MKLYKDVDTVSVASGEETSERRRGGAALRMMDIVACSVDAPET